MELIFALLMQRADFRDSLGLGEFENSDVVELVSIQLVEPNPLNCFITRFEKKEETYTVPSIFQLWLIRPTLKKGVKVNIALRCNDPEPNSVFVYFPRDQKFTIQYKLNGILETKNTYTPGIVRIK